MKIEKANESLKLMNPVKLLKVLKLAKTKETTISKTSETIKPSKSSRSCECSKPGQGYNLFAPSSKHKIRNVRVMVAWNNK